MALCETCGWDNPPTARFCENRGCGAYLCWHGSPGERAVDPDVAAVPATSPRAPRTPATRLAVAMPVAPVTAVAREHPTLAEPSSAGRTSADGRQGLFVIVPQRHVTVAPGAEATLSVRVRNTGQQIERAVVEILGLPDAWVDVQSRSTNLDVEQEATIVVHIRPPRLATTPAGRLAFTIVVWSGDNPHVRCEESCWLTVGSFESLAIRPAAADASARGRRAVPFAVTVVNDGNETVATVLRATPAQGHARARCLPERIQVAPGSSMAAVVTMRPRHRHIVGAPAIHTCNVTSDATPTTMPVTLTLRQRGWLPQIVGRLLVPLGAIALVVAVLVGRDLWADRPRAVPDVVGTTQEDAVEALSDAGFEVVPKRVASIDPEGEVVGQDPPADEERRGGTRVTIEVSEGPPRISVPEVRGQPYATAAQVLRDQHFNVVDGSERPDPAARVVAQDPKPGEFVPQGSDVELVVETTPPP